VNFAAEKLHYADDVAGDDDRKTERRVESLAHRRRGARKVRIMGDVCDEGGCAG
jgi:hypothetical protein